MIHDTEFQLWLRHSKPGDWCTYHTGPHLFGLNGMKKTTAAMALEAAERGDIFICQLRVDDHGNFAYKALRLNESLSRRYKSWKLK